MMENDPHEKKKYLESVFKDYENMDDRIIMDVIDMVNVDNDIPLDNEAVKGLGECIKMIFSNYFFSDDSTINSMVKTAIYYRLKIPNKFYKNFRISSHKFIFDEQHLDCIESPKDLSTYIKIKICLAALYRYNVNLETVLDKLEVKEEEYLFILQRLIVDNHKDTKTMIYKINNLPKETILIPSLCFGIERPFANLETMEKLYYDNKGSKQKSARSIRKLN